MRNTKRFWSRFVVASRTAGSLIWESCCQAHIASRPADRWTASMRAKVGLSSRWASSTLRRDADAVGLELLLLVGEGGVEAAQQPGEDLDGVALADAAAG